jgi:hypothetical protein
MKRWTFITLIGCLFLLPLWGQAQPDRPFDRFPERGPSRLRPEDLRVVDLALSPDPVKQGQRPGFRVTVLNQSRQSGRANFILRDRDDVIVEARDVSIQPGENRILFPETSYRFSRSDHCFTVEADIEHNRRPIDLATQFCARKTSGGWTLADKGIGPLFVDDLDMTPDPAMPGQQVRFRVRLRNDGQAIRGDIRIQDRDQVVARFDNVTINRGRNDIQLPFTNYAFQGSDRCFTVAVDVDRTPYRVDAAREFCAKPLGWTLKK